MLSDPDLARLARDVIDELYDCVFDPSGWRRVIRIIGLAAPELRPLLMVEAWEPAACQMFDFENIDPAVMQRYVDEFVDENAFRPSPEYVRRHKVVLSTDYAAQEDVVRTRFHGEMWMPHCDIRAASANVMSHDSRSMALLAFHYAYGEQSRSMPAGMRLHRMIGPHAERAFALAVRGASLARDARATDLLAALTTAAVLLDGRGRMIRCNGAAEALLGGPAPLRLDAAGALRAVQPADDAAVGAAVQRALRGDAPASTLVTAADGRRLELTAVPVTRRETNDAIFEAFVPRAEPRAVAYVRPV